MRLIENPAVAGPNTEASCQVVLLQVAAFGYNLLGTSKAIKEKIVGPKNALTIPPKKTKIYIDQSMVFEETIVDRSGQLITKSPRLITEKPKRHLINKLRFSF